MDMLEALRTLDGQIEYTHNIHSITEKLFNQLEMWLQQDLTVILDQEWKGLQERDYFYNQAMFLEEILTKNPHYQSGNEAIQQKIKQRNECIARIQELDRRISASFQSLQEKMAIQLSNMKLRNKATQRYGQLTWNNPAFIDERQ